MVGRAVSVITGDTGRRYEPSVRSLELENRQTNQRFTVRIDSPDSYFVLSLMPGDYRLNRVQISEGPFMSIADLSAVFSVESGPVTYVGVWRFGVDSPQYGRMVVVSMMFDKEESSKVRSFLTEQYPEVGERTLADVLPEPSQMEARLFEVMPYPRYPTYFRRHWW